ncbi:DUF3857 and transglutaminase domain-containing protein [Cryomorphaceae bacterium 1068]|nr:DUF3857 and transglutaminase domain-containing protein [Cryomorphaceae bacterium 1068]
MKHIALCFFLLLSVITSGQKIAFTEIPEWVKDEIPEITSKTTKNDVIGGAYTSVIDYQTNLITKDDYFFTRTHVLTETGVSWSSEISITIDTIYNELDFHYFRIIRDDQIIDRTSDLTLDFLSREDNLSQGIYTGAVTAHDILEDIRKGDIIEYAYTIKGENPIFEGHSYRSYALASINPIDYYRLRLIKDPKSEYFISALNMEDLPTWNKNGKIEELELVRTNLESFEFEESTPPWHIAFPYFFVSAFPEMSSVSNWAVKIFELENESKLAISTLFEQITAGIDKEEEKIDAIIRWVQNEIRYMGIESGIGSIKPFQPAQTIEQRYGDCKDKTLLLVSLLKEMDIEAYPYLVNSTMQHRLGDLAPGAQIFDHVITYFSYDYEDYYIDPTVSFQGGSLGKRATFDYGLGLLVKTGTELSEMEGQDNESSMLIEESFEIVDFENAGMLTVKSTLSGMNADYMRMYLDVFSTRELSKEFRAVYGVLYDVFEKEKLNISDDLNANIIEITEVYETQSIFKTIEQEGKEFYQMHYEPLSLYDYVSSMNCEYKNYPVYVPYPVNFKQITSVKLPLPLIIPLDVKTVDNSAFNYLYSEKMKDMTELVLSYTYRAKTNEIKNTEFNQVCRDMQGIIQELPLTLTFPKNL